MSDEQLSDSLPIQLETALGFARRVWGVFPAQEEYKRPDLWQIAVERYLSGIEFEEDCKLREVDGIILDIRAEAESKIEDWGEFYAYIQEQFKVADPFIHDYHQIRHLSKQNLRKLTLYYVNLAAVYSCLNERFTQNPQEEHFLFCNTYMCITEILAHIVTLRTIALESLNPSDIDSIVKLFAVPVGHDDHNRARRIKESIRVAVTAVPREDTPTPQKPKLGFLPFVSNALRGKK